ncbi:MAG: hypothetical protein WAV18_17680, partial [Roseiarcus sp.]
TQHRSEFVPAIGVRGAQRIPGSHGGCRGRESISRKLEWTFAVLCIKHTYGISVDGLHIFGIS